MKFVSRLAAVAAALCIPFSAHADDWTNLRYAVYMNQEAEVVRLLDSGIDINLQNEEGWTALHVAAEQGQLRMVSYLLARGADPNIKTKAGRTAYDVSEGYGEVRAALKAKMAPPADPFAAYLGGGAAAMPAAPASAAPTTPPAPVRAPAAAGTTSSRNGPNDGRNASNRARLEARDAVWYNNRAELEAILDAGLPINSLDETGRETLLHAAAWRDRVDIARMLLDRGASKTIRDKDGKLAADYAQSPAMRDLLGAPAPAAKPAAKPVSKATEDHCKKMWNEARALCSINDTSCNMSASIRYQSCQQKGTWY